MCNLGILDHIIEEVALLFDEIANDLIFTAVLSLLLQLIQLGHVVFVMKNTLNV